MTFDAASLLIRTVLIWLHDVVFLGVRLSICEIDVVMRGPKVSVPAWFEVGIWVEECRILGKHWLCVRCG